MNLRQRAAKGIHYPRAPRRSLPTVVARLVKIVGNAEFTASGSMATAADLATLAGLSFPSAHGKLFLSALRQFGLVHRLYFGHAGPSPLYSVSRDGFALVNMAVGSPSWNKAALDALHRPGLFEQLWSLWGWDSPHRDYIARYLEPNCRGCPRTPRIIAQAYYASVVYVRRGVRRDDDGWAAHEFRVGERALSLIYPCGWIPTRPECIEIARGINRRLNEWAAKRRAL